MQITQLSVKFAKIKPNAGSLNPAHLVEHTFLSITKERKSLAHSCPELWSFKENPKMLSPVAATRCRQYGWLIGILSDLSLSLSMTALLLGGAWLWMLVLAIFLVLACCYECFCVFLTYSGEWVTSLLNLGNVWHRSEMKCKHLWTSMAM